MARRRRRGLQLQWRRALIPLSLLVLFVLRFSLHAPFWVLVAVTMWIPLYYLVWPWLLKRRWKAFEADFALRFQKEDYKSLLDFYKRQWLLRNFGPRPEMLGKLGLIYSAMGKYREAEQTFEHAIDIAGNDLRDQLYFNLANVKYELAKYDDAEQIYKALRTGSPYQYSVRTQLALIDLHRGTRVKQAREFLERQRGRASGVVRARIEQALAEPH